MYSLPPSGALLALVGVTIIVTRGTIFRGLQEGRAKVFFACSLCFGFWVGALGLLYMKRGEANYLDFVLDGAAVAILSLLTDAVLMKLLGDPDDHA